MINTLNSSSSLFLRRNQFVSVESKNKFVTATEGGYVRSYLIKEDGTKIMLSETKQTQNDKESSTPNLLLSSKSPDKQAQSASSVNTKETMLLLNLNAGIPINVLKGIYQAEED